MADENKLWFEMGVRDTLTQTLQKGVELAEKLGQGLDNATKKQAIHAENLAKLKDGYFKIDEAIQKINKAMSETRDPALKSKMQQTLQELDKLRNGLKALEGDEKKMLERGSVASHMRQNNFALMTRSVNRYAQAVGASKRASRTAQDSEARRVDTLKTKYNELARIRDRLMSAISGAAPGVDTSKASALAGQLWSRQMTISRAIRSGGTVAIGADYKKLIQDAKDAAVSVEHLTREQNKLNGQLERQARRDAAASLREQAAAAKQLAQANMDLVSAYDKVTEAGKRTNQMWEQMKSYAGTFVSFYGLKSLLNDVIQIGGEFEVQHIALQSILGDVEQANTMFNEMKQLAVVSPFNFRQLATFSKQIAAFGIPYEEMYDTTKRLADISAGLGVDMNRLILAYGQVRSAAVLRGQELRQFTEAGIPMVQALANEFTKLNGRVTTTAEVFDLISKRAVPFEMVKKILWEMTDEGGRFYNMQYTLADTLTGKWSNLQDAWEIMLSEFARGESLSGKVLKTMVTWTTTLIENLERVTPILGGIIAGLASMKIYSFGRNVLSLGGYNTTKRIAQAQKLNAIKIQERYIQGEINAAEMQSLMNRNKDINLWKTQLMLSGRVSKMQLLRLNYQQMHNRRLLVELMQTGQIDRTMAKLLVKGKLMQASWRMIGTAIKTAFGPLGWVMIAIDAVAALLLNAWSRSNALAESNKQALESLQQRYEDLRQFIADNPIEISVKSTKLDDIVGAIDKYIAQLRTDFPDIADYLIGRSAGGKGLNYASDIESARTMLTNLRSITEELNNMQLAAKAFSSLFNDAASDSKGIFGDSVKDEIGQYDSRLSEYYKEAAKNTIDDYRKFAENLKEATHDFAKDAGKELERLINSGYSVRQLAEFVSGRFTEEEWNKLTADIRGSARTVGNLGSVTDSYDELSEQLSSMYSYIKKRLADEGRSLSKDENVNLFHILVSGWMSQNEVSEEMRAFINLYFDKLIAEDFSKKSATLPKIIADALKKASPEIASALVNGDALSEESAAEAQRVYNRVLESLRMKWPSLSGVIGSSTLLGGISDDVLLALGPSDGALRGWRKRLQEKLNKTPIRIGASMSIENVVEEMRKAYDTAETTVKKLGPIAVNAGIKLESIKGLDISQYQFTNPVLYEALKALQEAFATKGQIEVAGNSLGVDVKDMKKNGDTESHADKRLSRLKKEYELYKKFWSEYEKYTKLFGRAGALSKLRSDGEFSTIFGWGLSDLSNYAQSVEEIRRRLVGAKTAERSAFFDTMNSDVQAQRRKEESEAISAVNDALKTQLGILNEQYETYKKLYRLTGDKSGSASVAFGGRMVQSESYKDYLVKEMAAVIPQHTEQEAQRILSLDRKTFNDQYGANSEKLSVIYAAYQEHIVKLRKETLDLLASTIEKNRTIEQQIEDENRSYQHQLSLLKDIGDPKLRSEAEEGLRKEHEKKSSKLQFEQFKESSNWVRIFDDLDRVSMRTINSMIEKVERFSATTGLSVEEVKALRDALEKLRKEQSNRSPLLSLIENVGLGNRRRQLLHSGLFRRDSNGQWQGSVTMSTAAMAKRYGYSEGQTISAEQLENDLRGNVDMASEAIGHLGDKLKAMQDVMQPVIDLFSAMGEDGLSSFFQMGSDAFGSAAGAANGLNALGLGSLGPYGAAAAAGLSIMGSLFSMHDKAIEKEIQASKERQKLLENLTKNLESMLEHTLGGLYTAQASREDLSALSDYKEMYDNAERARESIANGTSTFEDQLAVNRNFVNQSTAAQIGEAQRSQSYYDTYKASLMARRDEAEYEMSLEEDRKKKDSGKIADLRQEIKELNDEIRYLAEEMAKDLYGIDYKSFASGLAESIVSAWEAGGNAADAYKKKVSQILKDVGVKVMTQKYIEPLLEKNMDEFLNQFEADDGLVTDSGMEILSRMYDDADKAAAAMTAYLDGLETLVQRHGGTLDTSSSSGGSSIRSITEQQSDLLISYINTMRADLSMHVANFRIFLDSLMPGLSNTLALQLAVLKDIEKNTYEAAVAAKEIRDLLGRVKNGSEKLYVKAS